MQKTVLPKDENLQLVLSVDQAEWLECKIRCSLRYFWLMCSFFLLSLAWLLIGIGQGSPQPKPDCLYLQDDPIEIERLQNEYKAGRSPLKICSPGQENQPIKQSLWEKVTLWMSFLAILTLLGTPIGMVRNFILWRKYKTFLHSHYELMKKYKRA